MRLSPICIYLEHFQAYQRVRQRTAGLFLSVFLAGFPFFSHADKELLSAEEVRIRCETGLTAYIGRLGERETLTVIRPGAAHIGIVYQRTNRGLKDGNGYHSLERTYGPRAFKPELVKGKRILDAGCGDGALVYYLNSVGAKAIGIDLHLNDRQRSEPSMFLQTDMTRTKLPANSIDLIFSSYSVFYYEATNQTLLHEILREFERILAPGGRILLGGNPAYAITDKEPDASTRREFLYKGWTGRNSYLEYFLPPGSKLKFKRVGRNAAVLEMQKDAGTDTAAD